MPIGEATIDVECDTCDYVEERLGLTSLASGGWDARNIEAKLKREGWRVDGDFTVCPECVEANAEK